MAQIETESNSLYLATECEANDTKCLAYGLRVSSSLAIYPTDTQKRQRWQLPTQVYCDKMQRHNPTKLCTVLSESPACVMSFHNQTVQHARQLVECVNTN